MRERERDKHRVIMSVRNNVNTDTEYILIDLYHGITNILLPIIVFHVLNTTLHDGCNCTLFIFVADGACCICALAEREGRRGVEKEEEGREENDGREVNESN